MHTLVGDDHRRIVELLITRVGAVADGDVEVPRVLILEGASGLGKSRIVREVYREMRARRDPEGYWPELDESGGSNARSRDPLPGRKRIGPPIEGFLWPAGVLPGFAWWQLQCERMQGGELVDIAAQARTQLAAHLVPVTLAWRNAASVKEKAAARKGDIATAAREALREGGMEAASRVLATFDVMIPGLGLAASWAMRGVAGAKNRFDEHRDVHTDLDLGQRANEQRRSVSAELAELLRGAAHREVPAIIVIEDLHLMGEPLAELLDLLSAPDPTRPVAVIGTATPQLDVPTTYSQWRADAITNGRAQIEVMPYLKPLELAKIVRAYAPNTTDDIAAMAADRYPNPLSLEVTLNLEQVQGKIAENDGALPPEALSARSPKLKGVYRDQFWELPEQVQIALAAAAAALPKPSMRVWPFVRGIVAESVQRCSDLPIDAAEILSGIEHAADDQVWLVPTGIADSFREALQAQIAYEHYEDAVSSGESFALRDAVTEVLVERVDALRADGYLLDDSEQTLITCRWLLELCPSDSSAAAFAAASRVAMDLADAYQFATAITTLASRLDSRVPSDHPHVLIIRKKLASWLGEVGRTTEAIAAYEQLLTDELRVLGADHFLTLNTRGSLAARLGEVGRTAEAIAAYEQLLADRLRLLGPDHPDTLTTRGNLASHLGGAGRTAEAILVLERLLTDALRVLGEGHPRTLTIRSRLASLLGEAKRTAEAIAAYEQLLTDAYRVLGPDHLRTLAFRNNLASLLGEAKRTAEAVAAYEQLLTDAYQILGPHHPGTLTIRINLASQLGKAKRTAEAIAAYEQLLTDAYQILGPDHPRTLTIRSSLACCLGDAGRTAESIAAYEQLLTDALRVLGPDHPDTLTARHGVAYELSRAGNTAEAIVAFERLLADRMRVLGPDHPHTAITRHNVDYLRSTLGN